MNSQLEGKRVLITGASRGIGRAVAQCFAQQGAELVLTARSADRVEPLCRDIAGCGGRAVAMGWDVADLSVVETNVRKVVDTLGGLDILVNNAGVVRLPEDAPDHSPEALWNTILDTNLKGLYFLCERTVPVMAEGDGGVIVNIASDAGLRGATNAYGMSKWGVVGYTRGLAKRVAGDGIRVNAVAPGPVATRMMNCRDGETKAWQAGPLGRYAYPEEVADVVLFLASPASRSVFGETIVVNSADL